MKYNEFTKIEDIISLINSDWESFKQDLVNQKIKSWVSEHKSRNDISKVIEEQLHEDWGTLYPFLSTLRIFEEFKQMDRDISDRFLHEFREKHYSDIEEEYRMFSLRNNHVDKMFGSKGSTSKPIVGFLLASDDDIEPSVYVLYDGINTFGSGSHPEDSTFQQIVTKERLLRNKHFTIEVSKLTEPKLHVIEGDAFRFESNGHFRSGIVDYRSHLVLGSLHLRILENFN